MNIIKVDFETYYDKDFNLSKLQTDEYILSGQYETIGVSVKDGDKMAEWFSGTESETKMWLSKFDWYGSAVCCHHTLFDGFILTQRYGIRPKLWMDTKAMATHLYPYLRSYSLASLAKHFKLRDKGSYVANMLGRTRESIDENEMMLYSAYCILDTEITHDLCNILLPRMSPLELRLIDMTIRMFTEPQFVGDTRQMVKLYNDEQVRKAQVLALAGVDKDVLMSNEKLAKALTALGVMPPTKVSAKTGKTAWAFAKNDQAFTELLEHDDPAVQALVAARLGVKSTIAETRALTMLNTSQRPAAMGNGIHKLVRYRDHIRVGDAVVGAPLPVYLNYWGAKTTGRYSGGNQCLVGDTQITVLRGGRVLDILISALVLTDLVWDGEEFVEHDGLIFQGYAEVIEYGGVSGTEDHKVFVAGREKPVELGVAAREGLVLQVGRHPRCVEGAAAAMPVGEGSVC